MSGPHLSERLLPRERLFADQDSGSSRAHALPPITYRFNPAVVGGEEEGQVGWQERLRADGRLNEMLSARSRSRLSCRVESSSWRLKCLPARPRGFSGPELHDVFADYTDALGSCMGPGSLGPQAVTGNNTCVTPRPLHRDRRGRSSTTRRQPALDSIRRLLLR